MKKHFLIVCCCLFLSACAGSSQPHVIVKSDEFSKEVEIAGVTKYENPFMVYKPHFWKLRTFVNRDTHVFRHQVFFYIRYKGDVETFKYAEDDTGMPLKVTSLYKVDCMSSTCEKTEALGILLKDSQLRQHEPTGMRIRMRSKSGENIILAFTPEMIRLQLEAVDKLVGSPLPKAPPTPSATH